MIIPKEAKVNGERAEIINGHQAYRVKLAGGPLKGLVVLAVRTELVAPGGKYILREDGNFEFEEGLK